MPDYKSVTTTTTLSIRQMLTIRDLLRYGWVMSNVRYDGNNQLVHFTNDFGDEHMIDNSGGLHKKGWTFVATRDEVRDRRF